MDPAVANHVLFEEMKTNSLRERERFTPLKHFERKVFIRKDFKKPLGASTLSKLKKNLLNLNESEDFVVCVCKLVS